MQKSVMANYIAEVAYKNGLKWLVHCSTETPNPGVFQPKEIHCSLLDT